MAINVVQVTRTLEGRGSTATFRGYTSGGRGGIDEVGAGQGERSVSTGVGVVHVGVNLVRCREGSHASIVARRSKVELSTRIGEQRSGRSGR